MTVTPPNHDAVADYPADGKARPAWVADALVRQLEFYQRLDTLSARQSELISDDNTDGLLAILGERQALIDRITEIGARLEPVRAAWEAFLLGLPGPTREQIGTLVDALGALAGRVAERDEADRRRLEERRAVVGAELTTIGRGRSALAAYGGRPLRAPVFQDREI